MALQWDLTSEELEAMKLIALGCHRSCHDAIAVLFGQLEIVSWSLNDYFLLRPLKRSSARANIDWPASQSLNKPAGETPPIENEPVDALPLTWRTEADRPQLYFPFFERRLRELAFVGDVDPTPLPDAEQIARYETLRKDPEKAIEHVINWPIQANTRAFSKRLRLNFETFVSHLADDTSGMRLIRRWAHAHWRKLAPSPRPSSASRPADRVQYPRVRTYTMGDLVDGLLAELTPAKPDVTGEERERRLNDLASARVEHAVNDHFWLLRARQGAPGLPNDVPRSQTPANEYVSVSIASEEYFYGYLVVEYPPCDRTPEGMAENETLRTKLLDELRIRASGLYLDVLVLYFNRVHEARLNKKLLKWPENVGVGRDGKSLETLAALVAAHDPFDTERDEVKCLLTTVEDHVRWLWSERKKWCHEHPNAQPAELQRLKDTLVLSYMQIASEPMVEVIRDLMNFGIRYDAHARGLPSALVVGGPGSGKDSTSRLIGLFARGYTFGEVRTVNMAALRPQALVGAMLQGAELPALLGREKPDPHPPVLPVLREGERGPFGSVILDELNSLDIDQQGILLRVLENKEITPLFGFSPQVADFLCVGVMNEDPQDLMKEDELRASTARSELFGRLLGTFVDETFRHARRLRPDLFYRMQRYGIVTLPSLQERRDDIPILFHGALPRTDNAQVPIKWEIELTAYERLMEKDLLWNGNIRELQAVARRIYRAVEATAIVESGTRRIRITRSNVEEVLREHLRLTTSEFSA